MASLSVIKVIYACAYVFAGILAFMIDYRFNDHHGDIRSFWDRVFPDLFIYITFWPLIAVLNLGGLILERRRHKKTKQ